MINRIYIKRNSFANNSNLFKVKFKNFKIKSRKNFN